MSELNQANQIFIENWGELRDLFYVEWPKYSLPYHLIQNFLDWHVKDPEYVDKNIQVYCLNGDWSDGTFYALDGNSIFFYSLNDDNERLITLLSLLPENREFLGCCVYERHLPVVSAVVSRIPNWVSKFQTMTHFHRFTKEQAAAMALDIPEGITLKPLSTDEHVAVADSVYPFRTEGVTSKGFKILMKFNISMGAFDADDNLLAWCFVYQSGILNALQVLDDGQKRRGLGGLVVKAMAKKFAEKGWDTFAGTTEGNVPSFKLFTKLGFEKIDQVHWIGFGNKDVSGTIGQIEKH